jgi:hypothetical protein
MSKDLAIFEKSRQISAMMQRQLPGDVGHPRQCLPTHMQGGRGRFPVAWVFATCAVIITIAVVYMAVNSSAPPVQSPAEVERLAGAIEKLAAEQTKDREAAEQAERERIEDEKKTKIDLSPKEQKTILLVATAIILIAVGFATGGPAGGVIALAIVALGGAYMGGLL